MSQSICNIHYARFLSIPVFGDFLYLVQLGLAKTKLTSQYWISKKSTSLRNRLLKNIVVNYKIIFCEAWQLGAQLKDYKEKYILSYTKEELYTFSMSELYDLQQALLFAKSITQESVPSLQPLLPQNFPIWRSFIISVREDLRTQCDFIKQTITELVKRDAEVIIFSHCHQSFPISNVPGKFTYLESSSPPLLHRLPYSLKNLVIKLWSIWIKYQLTQLTNKLRSPVCWFFDPDDVQTLNYLPANTFTIFDCVDYQTSLDPKLKKKIEKNKQVISQKVNLVVVNSNTLVAELKKIRPTVHLVPQGFDFASFANVKTTTPAKGKFFTALQQQKKKMPIVSFIGTLSWRIDYQLLKKVIAKNPKLLFCLPETILEWDSEDKYVNWQHSILTLKKLPNILWYPQLNRQEVNFLLEKTRVGIIPYDTAFEFNKYCFPMKVFEYFYKGLPVLATPIKELRYYSSYITTAKNPEEWRSSLEYLAKKKYNLSTKKKMKQLCFDHSWDKKITQVLNLLQQETFAQTTSRS